MNIPTSEYYSSGCESGWTVYFDQLSNSTDHQKNHEDFVTKSRDEVENNEDEEGEDLSMVSDASSGPPHYDNFQYNINGQNNYYGGGVYSQYYRYHTPASIPEEVEKKSSKSSSSSKKKQYNLCLDDTASSPHFDYSQDNVPPSDFSQVYSSEQFEGEYSMTKKKLGFFKSSTKGKSSSFLGRKRQ